MTDESEAELDARHAEKMRKKKAARDKIIATKTIEKGLLIVHTGKGKGKSTAAFGMVFRAIGHGMRVGVVQFVKGHGRPASAPCSRNSPTSSPSRRWARASPGRRRTATATSPHARAAWEQGQGDDRRPDLHAWCCSTSSTSCCATTTCRSTRCVALLRDDKPADKHVIVTGRNAREELIETADLVTEMDEVKHPFRQGVKAQKGIEF